MTHVVLVQHVGLGDQVELARAIPAFVVLVEQVVRGCAATALTRESPAIVLGDVRAKSFVGRGASQFFLALFSVVALLVEAHGA